FLAEASTNSKAFLVLGRCSPLQCDRGGVCRVPHRAPTCCFVHDIVGKVSVVTGPRHRSLCYSPSRPRLASARADSLTTATCASARGEGRRRQAGDDARTPRRLPRYAAANSRQARGIEARWDS